MFVLLFWFSTGGSLLALVHAIGTRSWGELILAFTCLALVLMWSYATGEIKRLSPRKPKDWGSE